MASESTTAPIIYVIKKKKGGHGGHHGGAWKVAYADFVTAMMALFIVLWLLNSTQDIRKAIGGYFQDPTGTAKLLGSAAAGSGHSIELKPENMSQVKDLIEQAMKQTTLFKKAKNNIQMTVTGEGLRIEMLENKAGMFFESGKAEPSETGREILTTIAKELGGLPNRILIEGHTDAKPFGRDGTYGNWELSTDRGNAARRWMETKGLRPGQVMEVRGFADQDLRTPADPENASNRRISVIVKYVAPPAEPAKPDKGAQAEKG